MSIRLRNARRGRRLDLRDAVLEVSSSDRPCVQQSTLRAGLGVEDQIGGRRLTAESGGLGFSFRELPSVDAVLNGLTHVDFRETVVLTTLTPIDVRGGFPHSGVCRPRESPN